MIARIRDNHCVYLDQLTADVEALIVGWFSVRSPDAYYITEGGGGWDGWYRRYSKSKQRLALPYLNELKYRCERARIPLEVVDERGAPKFPAPQAEQVTETFLEGVELESYQLDATKVCFREEIGIISSRTGSGKTEMMCVLVKAFRCPTLIITEQIVVLEQIVERLKLRDVVHNNDIGLFCAGKMPDNNLVMVGSIQSISSPKKLNRSAIIANYRPRKTMNTLKKWCEKKDQRLYHLFPPVVVAALYDNPNGVFRIQGKYLQTVTDYFQEEEWKTRVKAFKTRLENAQRIQKMASKCDLLLVDECDLATSTQYSMLFKKYFTGRRRYGFTGTPPDGRDKKKVVQALFLKEHLGNVIHQVPNEEVEKAKRVIPIKYVMIGIGEDGNRQDGRAYDIAMKEEMIENTLFHTKVKQVVQAFPEDRTLILVDTSPIAPLGFALEELISGSKFIYGSTPKKERSEVVADFEEGRIKCLIGSKIFKRGLDLCGGVDNLVVIGGGASWSDFAQKIGRAVRVNKRGWARVFGFFFFNNKYLYRHSKENLKAVVDLGYEARVIAGGTEIEGAKFIRSKFRLPKG